MKNRKRTAILTVALAAALSIQPVCVQAAGNGTTVDAKELTEKAEEIIKEHVSEPVEKIIKEEADEIKDTVKEQVVDTVKEAVTAAAEDTARNFWKDLKDSVISFFSNLFS